MLASPMQPRAGLPVSWASRLNLSGQKLVLPIAALSLVAAHLILSFLRPAQEWITPTAWISLYALALLATLRAAGEAPPRARWRWQMFAINFALAICSFAAILYAEYPARGNASASAAALWLNDLFRAWRSLPLLLVACKPEERQRSLTRWLDACQILILAVIFFILFYPPFLLRAGGQPDPILVNRYSYTLAIVLACLAILATLTSRTSDSRHFHHVLALYLSIGVPINIWTNHLLINTLNVPPSSPLFVPSDLCLLAFIFAIPWFGENSRPRPPSQGLLFLRLGTPAFLPLFTILASMLLGVAGHHPVLAICTGVAGVIIFGVRSAYGQFQLLSVQWSLESDNQRLESLSQHDSLTGLYNRRWFAETFPAEWARAQRLQLPFSLLLLDIDHFKLFNDTQGHLAGDICLQSVSRLIATRVLRPGDALVRYGGEEFVVMLPGAGAEGASRIAKAIMQALEDARLPHSTSPFGYVTMSIGGISLDLPQPGALCDDLLLQADTALYEAKKQGRNRVRLIQTSQL
ncbi:MAG TPA: GGDEF domain-containing protein [Acidobacteriaceae bacterium]